MTTGRGPNQQILKDMKNRLHLHKEHGTTDTKKAKAIISIKRHALVLREAQRGDVFKSLLFFVEDLTRRKSLFIDIDVEGDPDKEYRRKIVREGMVKGMNLLLDCFFIDKAYQGVELITKDIVEEEVKV